MGKTNDSAGRRWKSNHWVYRGSGRYRYFQSLLRQQVNPDPDSGRNGCPCEPVKVDLLVLRHLDVEALEFFVEGRGVYAEQAGGLLLVPICFL